jgi:DNA-binding FadR family transcriptional regulator
MIHKNLHEQVVEELGLRIISGQYRSGETLSSEDELCAELNVSRTVIREATKVLAEKGLVRPQGKVGTRVQERAHWNLLDKSVQTWEYAVGQREKLLRDVTEIRRIIEPEACRLAALRATTEAIAEIEAAYREMERTLDNEAAYVEADSRFHVAILGACENELLYQLAGNLRVALSESYRTTAQTPGGLETALPFHRVVLEAIQQHRPNDAYLHMQRLIDRVWLDIDLVLGKHLPLE